MTGRNQHSAMDKHTQMHTQSSYCMGQLKMKFNCFIFHCYATLHELKLQM